MPQVLFPFTGGLTLSAQLRTYLALSTTHLYQQSLSLLPTITKAALVAAEADYDGYSALTATTWNPPYLNQGGGVAISPGDQQFSFVFGAGRTNTIYGAWIEDAAGNLIAVSALDAPVAMVMNGNAIPLNFILVNFA